MPTMLQTILQLFILALHEAPELLDDAKKLFHAIGESGSDGMQKVVNTADALAQLADHARDAAIAVKGNPDAVPKSTLPQPGSVVSEPFPKDHGEL